MIDLWYDNAMDADPDDPGWLDIERVYCLDWDAFRDADWDRLRNIYSQLPGYRTNTRDSFPRWFSDTDDPTQGYLWASVEPPGLQVAGTLRRTDWDVWHERFSSQIEDLPRRGIQ